MKFDSLIRKFKWNFAKYFFSNDKRLWQRVLFYNEDFKKGRIIPLNSYYTKKIKQTGKKVICIFDGKINSCGLADRIKGIISIFEICKEQGIDFKILFTHPFKLTTFLVPNKINWEIKECELNYNREITDICYIYSIAGTTFEADMQRKWFNKWFKSNKNEFHVRTNARTFNNATFEHNFDELFTIVPRLRESINRETKILGESYISTSFRFLNLMGDFNEPGQGYVLNEFERNVLIERNIEQLQKLHEQHPTKKILVNSDSSIFLHEASRLNYVHTIPGTITHIGGENSGNEYETYEKTFLDFFMIANAEKIFLLKTGKMYRSGYPGIASLIKNRPFEIIEF